MQTPRNDKWTRDAVKRLDVSQFIQDDGRAICEHIGETAKRLALAHIRRTYDGVQDEMKVLGKWGYGHCVDQTETYSDERCGLRINVRVIDDPAEPKYHNRVFGISLAATDFPDGYMVPRGVWYGSLYASDTPENKTWIALADQRDTIIRHAQERKDELLVAMKTTKSIKRILTDQPWAAPLFENIWHPKG